MLYSAVYQNPTRNSVLFRMDRSIGMAVTVEGNILEGNGLLEIAHSIAAITSGADAVYVGGKRYGARAYAGNFETEDLIECMQLAHLHEKKVYLTVNTLMKDSEIDELASFLRPFYEEGLDGVIVQDLGASRQQA